jgi:hypothetical protein
LRLLGLASSLFGAGFPAKENCSNFPSPTHLNPDFIAMMMFGREVLSVSVV